MKRYFLFVLALLSAPAAANAQTCAVTTSPVNFGSVISTASDTYKITGSITVSCPGYGAGQTVNACIEIAMGITDSQGNRVIYHGGASMPAQLYQDNARSFVWGTSGARQAQSLQLPGNGTQTLWVYGSLFAPANSTPGPYRTDFVVTMNYDTASVSCGTSSGNSLMGASYSGKAATTGVKAK